MQFFLEKATLTYYLSYKDIEILVLIKEKMKIMRMKAVKMLSLIACTLLISACMNSKLYHPDYGFKDDNPAAYNADQKFCSDEAYYLYPVISPPKLKSPPRDLPRKNQREIDYANRVLSEIEHQNQVAMDEYRKYNYSRDSHVRKCMDLQGWHYVQVEEEK